MPGGLIPWAGCPVRRDERRSRLLRCLGGNRGRIHTDFNEKIVDLNLGRPSHLVRAAERGLGETDLSMVKVHEESV